jgi:hypothetical protein
MTIHKISEHFSEEEMKCRCCGLFKYRRQLIEKLELLRSRLNDFYEGEAEAQVIVNSGTRCRSHNITVGGRKHSDHLSGRAADIKINLKPKDQDDVHKIGLFMPADKVLEFASDIFEYSYKINEISIHVSDRSKP